jgi:hypothetical protein
MIPPRSVLLLALAALPLAAQQRPRPAAPAATPAIASDLLGALRYRHVGPVGNRVTAVVSIPGDANTYYVGAASGGIWKTTDAGTNWTSIFDDFPVQSIGGMERGTSEPKASWVGTARPSSVRISR